MGREKLIKYSGSINKQSGTMRYCLFFLISFLPLLSPSQSLLTNGDFEEENTCFEYKKDCAPEGWFASEDVFLSYFKDPQRAQHGAHCLAITAGHSTKQYKRTFQQSQLLCGLRQGNKYIVELYVKSVHPLLDSIGIYMPPADFLFSNQSLQSVTPSFYFASTSMSFAKDSSWQKVSYVYTANGNEAFFVIANFSKRDISGRTGLDKENNFLVFVDNVSIRPLAVDEQLCTDWRVTKDKLYAQDERHEFLRQKIKKGKVEQPLTLKLTKNSVRIIDTVLISDINFETGSATLTEESYLLSLGGIVKDGKPLRLDSIIVEGHADSSGSYEFNNELAYKRALAVKEYLLRQIINVPIVARGYSFTKPIAPNDTEEGRRKNRRVRIFLYRRE